MVIEGVALLFELKPLQQLFRAARVSIEAGEHFERFAHADFVGQGSGLERGARDVFHLEWLALRVEAAYSRNPAVRCAHPLENLDCCRYSRAIRAEQSE